LHRLARSRRRTLKLPNSPDDPHQRRMSVQCAYLKKLVRAHRRLDLRVRPMLADQKVRGAEDVEIGCQRCALNDRGPDNVRAPKWMIAISCNLYAASFECSPSICAALGCTR
jgi:hypothetical protein